MEQRNRYCLNLFIFNEALSDPYDFFLITGVKDLPIAGYPFRDLFTEISGNKGRRQLSLQVEDIVHLLSSHLENISKPFGRKQSGLGAFPLDNGVCH